MVGKEDYYYISLDTETGTVLSSNQGHFEWVLDRALPRGGSISLCQFNFSTTSAATGFGTNGLNGVLIVSENLGPRNQSYVSIGLGSSKPVPTCILAQIPNQSVYTNDGSEILLGSYEPYNPIVVDLSPHNEIFEVRLKLTDPDGNSIIAALDSDLDWSVLLKVQYPQKD